MSPAITPPSQASISLRRDPGPTASMASASGVGLVPGAVFRLDQHGGGTVLLGIIELDGAAEPRVLQLALYPDLMHDPTSDDSPDPCFDSCAIGVELALHGRRWTATDQHGHLLDPVRRCLVGDGWNLLTITLDATLDGTLEVHLTSPDASQGGAWVQLVGLSNQPEEADRAIDRVRTLRGSHSAYLYSRGNVLPRVGLPQARHHLVPLTDAGERNWLYDYHHRYGPSPRLEGFGVSHLPSPWLGDRGAFQLMPWVGRAELDGRKRSLPFERASEVGRVHRYEVRLDAPAGAIDCELVPTEHGGLFGFDFATAAAHGPHGAVLTLPFNGRIDTHRLPDGRLAFTAAIAPHTGWLRELDHPEPPSYVYGETSVPVRARRRRSWRTPFAGRWWRDKRIDHGPLGWLRWPLTDRNAVVLSADPGAERLELRLAMSFISVANAEYLLHHDQHQRSTDDLRQATEQVWSPLLEGLRVSGGTPDQRVTAWSNLAQLQLWPSRHDELLGPDELDAPPNSAGAELPVRGYASPYRPAVGAHSREHTGCEIVPGPLLVNHGYWDTYRTCWPWQHQFAPLRSAELLSGVLQQYRDGGWMARWAAPGYVDLMVGTSSDAIFADAAARGVFGAAASGSRLWTGGTLRPDELDAWDSAVRNATCPSPDRLVGRHGQASARFRGWTDAGVSEGLSWTVDNASCDAALALWAQRLAGRAASDPALAGRAEEFAGYAHWFAQRGLAHRSVLNPELGFFVGRRADGSWRIEAGDFDPKVWGHDYTETNAWGQRFHAPHDGAGLAQLLGGEAALEQALDDLLATGAVTRPAMYGGYDYNTQEMNEAQNHGLGQLAISNQPAHHIPYMYLFAGAPHKTQWLTRELLDTRFVGSEIGQGYPGDEDNGELSTWWLWTALGLYPLWVGSGEYVLTSPLFESMAITRDDGTTLRVQASGVDHRYIQSVRINGEPWHRVSVPAELIAGDTVIEIELGPEPSDWGADSRPLSWSEHRLGQLPATDLTASATVEDGSALVDDVGDGTVELAAGDHVVLAWPKPQSATLLTLTAPGMDAPPLRLELLTDDGWAELPISWRAPRFADQLIPYPIDARAFTGMRLTALDAVALTQLELF